MQLWFAHFCFFALYDYYVHHSDYLLCAICFFFYAFGRAICTLPILCFALRTIFLGSTCFVLYILYIVCIYYIVYILISCVLHCLFSFWALYFGQFVFFAPGVLFILCFVLNAVFCFCIVLCNHYCVCLKIWGTNIQVGISSLCSTGNNSLCQNIKHHNAFPRQHKWRTLKLCVHLSALLFPRGLHTI